MGFGNNLSFNVLHKQNPNSPMNEFMRDEYNKNKSQFISNAKDWVKKYANITNFDDPSNYYPHLS